MLNLRGLSGSSSGGVKGAGGSGVGVMGGGGETDVSQSVRYVLDLFIAAYFQFDTKVMEQLVGLVVMSRCDRTTGGVRSQLVVVKTPAVSFEFTGILSAILIVIDDQG